MDFEEKGVFAKYIRIDPEDLPTVEQLEGAIIALRRCEQVFGRLRNKKDPPALSMDLTADFLERLVREHKAKLRSKP